METALEALNPTPDQSEHQHAQAQPMHDHLAELRDRLIISVTSIVAGIALAFFSTVPIINSLKALAPATTQFVQLTPGEVLMSSMKLAIYAGIAGSSPIWLYHVLRFIMPGLTPKEKSWVGWIAGGGSLLFLLGIVFAYQALIPSTLIFFMDYGQSVAQNQMSIALYIDFCMMLLLISGILFELPLVLVLLSLTGLVTSKLLIDQWRMAVVIIVIASAIITPSQDPISMILVALAMIGLYMVSLIPMKILGK